MTAGEAAAVLAGLVARDADPGDDCVLLGPDELEAVGVAIRELARDGRPAAEPPTVGGPAAELAARPSFARYRC